MYLSPNRRRRHGDEGAEGATGARFPFPCPRAREGERGRRGRDCCPLCPPCPPVAAWLTCPRSRPLIGFTRSRRTLIPPQRLVLATNRPDGFSSLHRPGTNAR